MSDFTKWVDLVNKLRAENAAITAERDRYKEALERILANPDWPMTMAHAALREPE